MGCTAKQIKTKNGSRYSPEIKEAAKSLYIKRWSPAAIRDELKLNNERIVRYWAKAGNWENMLQHESVEQAIARRLIVLTEKDYKTDAELKEIDRLINALDKLAGIDKKKAQTAKLLHEAANDDSVSTKSKKKGRKRKKKANDFSDVTAEQLQTIRKALFYDYQRTWYDNKHQRTRFILKSRQIGATFYFAWEALEDAILTGDNQVFLSASRAQAEIFKAYMIAFSKEYFDVELKGDPMVLHNDAELRFLSTSVNSVHGYHGHLYVDEVFWIRDFKKVNSLASGIAMHKKWRKTYFSTPSAKSHSAYPMWSGERHNDKRGKKKKLEFDISHKTLKHGAVGPDNIWRHIVTVMDADEQGCDLFDIEELRNEYTKNEFDNLLMCQFMEEGNGVFRLDDLLSCGVDSNVVWVDFKRKQKRPIGNRPVWVGYDPARSGDRSMVAVIAPPLSAGETFRVLELIELKGSYAHQANRIKEITEKYNVEYLGVDCTGPGIGVYERVQEFYPRVTPIHYGLETKTALVLKAQDVIEGGRITWDAGSVDIAQSFLKIRQVTTKSDQITYNADRSTDVGHCDSAWAIMHGLNNEPLRKKVSNATIKVST